MSRFGNSRPVVRNSERRRQGGRRQDRRRSGRALSISEVADTGFRSSAGCGSYIAYDYFSQDDAGPRAAPACIFDRRRPHTRVLPRRQDRRSRTRRRSGRRSPRHPPRGHLLGRRRRGLGRGHCRTSQPPGGVSIPQTDAQALRAPQLARTAALRANGDSAGEQMLEPPRPGLACALSRHLAVPPSQMRHHRLRKAFSVLPGPDPGGCRSDAPEHAIQVRTPAARLCTRPGDRDALQSPHGNNDHDSRPTSSTSVPAPHPLNPQGSIGCCVRQVNAAPGQIRLRLRGTRP